MSLSNSDYIAVSAAVIFVCAIAATLWQGFISRKHNRLSVRPFINIINSRGETESGVAVLLIVRNVGIGPALISAAHFTKNGEPLTFQHPRSTVEAVFSMVYEQSMQYRIKQSAMLTDTTVIPHGGEVILVDVEFPTLRLKTASVIDDYEKEYGFHVKYHSLYGEEFESSLGQ